MRTFAPFNPVGVRGVSANVINANNQGPWNPLGLMGTYGSPASVTPFGAALPGRSGGGDRMGGSIVGGYDYSVDAELMRASPEARARMSCPAGSAVAKPSAPRGSQKARQGEDDDPCDCISYFFYISPGAGQALNYMTGCAVNGSLGCNPPPTPGCDSCRTCCSTVVRIGNYTMTVTFIQRTA